MNFKELPNGEKNIEHLPSDGEGFDLYPSASNSKTEDIEKVAPANRITDGPSDVIRKDAIRPEHYGGEANPFEPIKIIQHYNMGFELGNTIKYVLRAGKKDPSKYIEDLKKAIQYIQFEIDKTERQSIDKW